jgi:O-antigen/teichoic acid export membrane protein
VVLVCSYMVVFPLLGLIFVYGLLPVKYALVFYALLTMEHLSQELFRVLVAIDKPLVAGILLFIRSGAWSYALIAAYYGGFVQVQVDLQTVLWLWVWTDTLALTGSIWVLRKLPWGELTWGINWAWIYRGLKVSALLLVGTIALRAIFTLDRYFVEIFAGSEMLGVYTLYFSICFSLTGFVDAAVIQFHYQALVSLYQSNQHAVFKSALSDFGRQTLIAVMLLTLVAGVLIVPALELIGKPIYQQNFPIFFLMLASSSIYIIGQIPHFALYAMGQDRSNVRANVAGFIAFIVLTVILAPRYKMCGVAVALFMSVVAVWVLKQWSFFVLRRAKKLLVNNFHIKRKNSTMDIFICTKPLQLIVCMIINKKNTDNHLYIVDSFYNSQEIADAQKLKKLFKKVSWFKSRHDALRAAANEKPSNIYIDSDVGFKTMIELCKLKIKSKITDIQVYEEGIGTYMADLFPSKIKRKLYTSLGLGCNFGGAFVTQKIHIFNPDLFKKNIPYLSKKAVGIEDSLVRWAAENKSDLIKIFSPGFKIENTLETKVANLYLTDWNADKKSIEEVSNLGKLFIKPHPHIKKEILDKIPKNKNIELIPSSLPAEIVIILFLEMYDKVRVYHNTSSCLMYCSELNIESIDISKS